ncbi:hypothetical protein BJ165DRAFT_734388 [Panaeolus papilionaceus]|nr:hypothetical protein BJ165DRAFT_734388 [Panaeolus papilionaceus]
MLGLVGPLCAGVVAAGIHKGSVSLFPLVTTHQPPLIRWNNLSSRSRSRASLAKAFEEGEHPMEDSWRRSQTKRKQHSVTSSISSHFEASRELK